MMPTKHKKRRLRRRLIWAGVLVAALCAWAVPVAEAHPLGMNHAAAPAAAVHVRLFHPNPRDRAGFYKTNDTEPVTPVTPVAQSVSGSAGDGFDWAAAGVGAGLTTLMAGLLAVAIGARRSIVMRDPSTGGAA
jgi:hypothetical protein